jgi:hypothetical protein
LNLEGTYQFAVKIDSAITAGTPLFVSTTDPGYATDENTGYYVGQAITGATVDDEIIEVGGVVGSVSSTKAEDVTIEDSGEYYTSENVEDALQEIGARLVQTDIEVNLPIFYIIRTDSSFDTLDVDPDFGGYLAGDTDELQLLNDGVLYVRCNIATGSTYCAIQAAPIPGYDPAAGFGLFFYYKTAADTDDWTLSVQAYGLQSDGTIVDGGTVGGGLAQATTITRYELVTATAFFEGIADLISMNFMVTLTNTGETASPLYIYSVAYDYNKAIE